MRFLLRWQHVAPDTQLEGRSGAPGRDRAAPGLRDRRGRLGGVRCCRRASPATGPSGSTTCACPATSPGRGSRVPQRAGGERRPRRRGAAALTPSRATPVSFLVRDNLAWLLRRRAGRGHARAARRRRRPATCSRPAHARRALLPRARRAPPAGSASRSRRGCGTWSRAGSSPPTASAACARSSAPASAGLGARRGPRPGERLRAARARRSAAREGRWSLRAAAARRRREPTSRPSPRRSPSSSSRARASCSATRVARETLAVPVARGPLGAPPLEARGTVARRPLRHRLRRRAVRAARRRRGLRDVRRRERSGEIVRVAAVDPLNLVGILTPGPRVPGRAPQRRRLPRRRARAGRRRRGSPPRPRPRIPLTAPAARAAGDEVSPTPARASPGPAGLRGSSAT